MIEGIRILCSRKFWRTFKDYWSPEQIAVRLDAYAYRLQHLQHLPPDDGGRKPIAPPLKPLDAHEIVKGCRDCPHPDYCAGMSECELVPSEQLDALDHPGYDGGN